MEKIAIICCGKITDNCSGKGCKRAFKERTDAFSNYPSTAVKLIALIRCRRCNEKAMSRVVKKTNRLLKKGVETVHLSSCMFTVCARHPDFIKFLSEQFVIIEGTHTTQK